MSAREAVFELYGDSYCGFRKPNELALSGLLDRITANQNMFSVNGKCGYWAIRSGVLALRVTNPLHRFCDYSGQHGYYTIIFIFFSFIQGIHSYVPRQTMSLGDTLLQLLFRFIVNTLYGA